MHHIQSVLNPASIYHVLQNCKSFALVVPDNKTALRLKEEVNLFSEYLGLRKRAEVLYKNIMEESQFFDYEKFTEETSSLYKIFIEHAIPILSLEAFFKRIPQIKKDDYKTIKIGDTLDSDSFSEQLLQLGYHYEVPVEEKGAFQIKGGIIDVFVPYYEHPIRLEMFGDEVESIRFFDADFQTTIKEIKEFRLIPSMNFDFSDQNVEAFQAFVKQEFDEERMSYEKMDALLSAVENKILDKKLIEYAPYFYRNPTTVHALAKKKYQHIFLYDFNQIEKEAELLLSLENHDIYYDIKSLEQMLSVKRSKKMYKIAPILEPEDIKQEHIVLQSEIQSPYRIILQEPKTYFRLSKLIEENIKLGKEVIIFYVVEDRKKQIENILNQFHVVSKKITWRKGLLKNAFQSEKEIFLSDYLILGVYSPPASTKRMKNIISSFSDLNKGDYVVHTNFGIGKYMGIVSKEIHGQITDFLEIVYAKSDKLFLPVYNLSLLYKHSSNDKDIRLDSFRSKAWENRKRRIKKSIEKIAKQLIELYAQRMSAKGHAYAVNDELYDSFSQEFPYLLTQDQSRAIDEINKDMEEVKPMDRLVCGDVGFGKTEVAMRAAFKAVADNKQVAILAPTTVLSFQHFLTFKKRFANFPVEVNFVSSFKSAKEKKVIFEDLKKGRIDVLIGTQAILSKMVNFKSLGLLIVDEEHKFGVKDKEKLRELKLNIDTLAMSATPIPRTLNFSLSGIRDLSIINTPPKDRKSVKTVVMKKNKRRIQEAISFELERGGQIFYIHNRIGTIYQEADYLLELFPNIKLAIAHAELPKSKLEKLMMEFYDGKFDLLLATNIIESGIDIPNANTILIDRADHFGLASLYQLRGRVGRAERQGYCILLLPKKGAVTPIAERRLSVISRYTDLGSGFQIAMQDMEIRGAGTLLGFAQKGHVDEIGYETYMNFLKESLAELKGEKPAISDFKTELNTAFTALIPSYYIEDEFTRLAFYKALSNAVEDSEVDEITEELKDRFGMFPEELLNFIYLVKIKIRAMTYRISKITISRAVIYMVLDDPDLLNLVNLIPFLNQYPNIKFGQKNDITITSQFSELGQVLAYFNKVIEGLMIEV